MKKSIKVLAVSTVVLATFASCGKKSKTASSETKDIKEVAYVGYYDNQAASRLVWDALKDLQATNAEVKSEIVLDSELLSLTKDLPGHVSPGIRCSRDIEKDYVSCKISNGKASSNCVSCTGNPPNFATIGASLSNPADKDLFEFNAALVQRLKKVAIGAAMPGSFGISYSTGRDLNSDKITCHRQGTTINVCSFSTIEFSKQAMELHNSEVNKLIAGAKLFTVDRQATIFAYQNGPSGDATLFATGKLEVGQDITVIETVVDQSNVSWAKFRYLNSADGYGLVLKSKLTIK